MGRFGECCCSTGDFAKVWKKEKQDSQAGADSSQPSGQSTDDASLTAQGPLQATPLYMSPEQITESTDIDHRTDIFSIGAVIFELLTLQHMAWGETIDEMLHNTQYRRTPLPSLVSPDREIPALLETLCLRCAQKDPDHRIQHVRELIHELLYWKRLRAILRARVLNLCRPNEANLEPPRECPRDMGISQSRQITNKRTTGHVRNNQ